MADVDEAGRQVDYAIALNVLCLVVGRRWMKAFTELIGAAFSLVFFIELWHAFPFEFPGASFDWALIARFVVDAGIVGSVVGIVVQLIMMIVPRTQRRLN